MIEQLRKIYSSLLVYKDGMDTLDSKYKWFVTDTKEVIGIGVDELTPKDVSLLTTFLVPYNLKLPILTEEEEKWRKLIHSTESSATAEFEVNQSYRFVYFSIKENQISPILFKDAIHELFTKKVPILWENGHEGIIIEEKSTLDEDTSYEQIIDILMSDLYIKINFFVGPFKEGLDEISQYYLSLSNAARTLFTNSNKTVGTYIDAVPYLFIDQAGPDLRQDIGKIVLQEYINDEETLKMIETFVQCNLNISETSKVLHMHRNSLQYRLDRFLEKTGIDIRQFHQAMTVYLALLARK